MAVGAKLEQTERFGQRFQPTYAGGVGNVGDVMDMKEVLVSDGVGGRVGHANKVGRHEILAVASSENR